MNRLSSSCSGHAKNLTATRLDHENPQLHENSVEWRITESSTEDSLVGRASKGSLFSRASVNVTGERTSFPAFESTEIEGKERNLDVERNSHLSSKVAKVSFFMREGKSSQKLPVQTRKPQWSSLQEWSLCQGAVLNNDSSTSNGKDVIRKADNYYPESEVLYPCKHLKSEEIFTKLYVEDMNSKKDVKHDAASFSNIELEAMKLRRRSESFPPPLASSLKRSYAHLPPQLAFLQLHPIRSPGRFQLLEEVKLAPQSLFQPIRTEGRLVLQLLHHCARVNLLE